MNYRTPIILLVRTLMTVCGAILFTRLSIEVVGLSNWGIFNTMFATISITTFYSGSISNVINRYASLEKRFISSNILKYMKIILKLFIISTCLSLFVLLLIYQLYDYHSKFVLFFILTLSIFTRSFSDYLTSLLIVLEYPVTITMITLIEITMKVYLIMYLSFTEPIANVIYSTLVSSIITCALLLLFLLGLSKKETQSRDNLTISNVRSYFGWVMIGSLAGNLNNFGVTGVIGATTNPVFVASRAVTNQLAQALFQVVRGFHSGVAPHIIHRYSMKGGNNNEFNDVSKLNLFIFFLGSTFLLIFNNEVVYLLTGENISHAEYFIFLTMVVTLIDVVSLALISIVQAKGNMKLYMTRVGSLMLFTLPMYVISSVLFSSNWLIFYCLILSSLMALAARVIFVKKHCDNTLEIANILKSSVLILILYCLLLILKLDTLNLKIAVFIIVNISLFAILDIKERIFTVIRERI